jgi:hypothetical protein
MGECGVELSDEQVQQILEHLKAGPQRLVYDSDEDLDALLEEVFHGTVRPHGAAAGQPAPTPAR